MKDMTLPYQEMEEDNMAKNKKEDQSTQKKKNPMLEKYLSAFCYIAIGLILLLNPSLTMKTISYVAAAVIIAIGAMKMLNFFAKGVEENFYRNDLLIGGVCIVLGLIMIINTGIVASLISALLGIFVFVSGISKVQLSFIQRRMGGKNWSGILIIALINIGIGLVLVLMPFKSSKLIIRLIGLCVTLSGLSDLGLLLYIGKKIKAFRDEQDVLTQDGKEVD